VLLVLLILAPLLPGVVVVVQMWAAMVRAAMDGLRVRALEETGLEAVQRVRAQEVLAAKVRSLLLR
jgi:hypothetical protein